MCWPKPGSRSSAVFADGPPPILDPFAGGGSIPLEAQRLGLTAFAGDLNPVAVLINKAMIEIPPRFAGLPPVHPGIDKTLTAWQRAQGLAADVQAYGQWMRDEAQRRIGHLYPDAVGLDGERLTPIAWIWARTVQSPDPAWSGHAASGQVVDPLQTARQTQNLGRGLSSTATRRRSATKSAKAVNQHRNPL